MAQRNYDVVIEPFSDGGALSRNSSGTQIMSNTDPGIVWSNAFNEGLKIGVKGGLYKFKTPVQIPNINSLKITGGIDNIATIMDYSGRYGGSIWNNKTNRNNHRQLGVFNHSYEDDTFGNATPISNLTICNFIIMSDQTPRMYREDDLYGHAIRLDLVTNCKVDNITTYNTANSIGFQRVTNGIISNCKSYYDSSGPYLSHGVSGVSIVNCYVYASMDDGIAILGDTTFGDTKINKIINCIVDKDMQYDVDAACYKIDSSATGGVHDNEFINCVAKNAKPGSPNIQGGFINGDVDAHHHVYTRCLALNNKKGIAIAGDYNTICECVMANNDIGLNVEPDGTGNVYESSPSLAYHQNGVDIKD